MVTAAEAQATFSRDELVAMVAKSHQGGAYSESTLAGRALAAQSKLPKIVAENLGAGFGQWDFFPEASEIVDFALAYVPPMGEEDVWSLARTWASDDAAGRPTLMTLVGREILQQELRRIEVPQLRELVASRPAQALAMRASLGLDVPVAKAPAAPKKAAKRAPPKASAAAASPSAGSAPRATGGIPARMPKPAFVRPVAAAPVVVRRFEHPKFGQGVLEAVDGTGPDAKLTIKFAIGPKTLLARYVTEVADG